MNSNWYLFENEAEYDKGCARLEQVKSAVKGSNEHKEKMLLAFLIGQYEKKHYHLPELDPVELIKIRMADFGLKASDLAKEYGDKGTVSKVLNYKQALSLTMIRKFSKILRIPTDSLIKEYDLQ